MERNMTDVIEGGEDMPGEEELGYHREYGGSRLKQEEELIAARRGEKVIEKMTVLSGAW